MGYGGVGRGNADDLLICLDEDVCCVDNVVACK